MLLAPAGVLEADREDVWVVLGVEHRLLRGTACALAADLVGRLVGADDAHYEAVSAKSVIKLVRGIICSDNSGKTSRRAVPFHSFSRVYGGSYYTHRVLSA